MLKRYVITMSLINLLSAALDTVLFVVEVCRKFLLFYCQEGEHEIRNQFISPVIVLLVSLTLYIMQSSVYLVRNSAVV